MEEEEKEQKEERGEGDWRVAQLRADSYNHQE